VISDYPMLFCLFFFAPVTTYGFWAFCRCLSRYRYDVGELKKTRVSLAKPAQSCGKNPGEKILPETPNMSPVPGTTHNRACLGADRRDMPSCPSMQRYPSILSIGLVDDAGQHASKKLSARVDVSYRESINPAGSDLGSTR